MCTHQKHENTHDAENRKRDPEVIVFLGNAEARGCGHAVLGIGVVQPLRGNTLLITAGGGDVKESRPSDVEESEKNIYLSSAGFIICSLV